MEADRKQQIDRPAKKLREGESTSCENLTPAEQIPLGQRMSIRLVEQEKKLFEFLLAVVNRHGQNTILRVAGGWVRDKLLGMSCKDIDIALDNVMGQQFAEQVHAYMRDNGMADQVKSVGVIKSNPDQSKHLETATTQVLGSWIDFVNLRKETYADSRIPTMEIGTPLEDALRRDLTINSLFYNINEGKVEDFTENGLRDLQKGIIRTPLDPHVTLTDDPLRALRAVRFACRFGFNVCSQLQAALGDPSVHAALHDKVSRERILTELDGMLRGPRPAAAMHMLHEHNLLKIVFDDSGCMHDSCRDWQAKVMALVDKAEGNTWKGWSAPLEKNEVSMSEDEHLRRAKRLGCLTCCTWAFQTFPSPDPKAARKGETLAGHSLRVGLKSRMKDVDAVTAIHKGVHIFRNCQRPFTRLSLGSAIRSSGSLWQTCVALGKLEDELELGEGQGGGEFWEEIELKAREWNLEDVWSMKGLLNGKEVGAITGAKGPELGQWTKRLIDWQIESGSCAIGEAEAFLREKTQEQD